MAATQSPITGLDLSPEAAIYVATLERQIAALTIQATQFRAVLEMLTDEPWDDVKLDIDGKTLINLAAQSLSKRTGMSEVDARVLAQKRWATYNKPSLEMDSVPAGTGNPPQQVDMAKRLADWKARNAKTQATE